MNQQSGSVFNDIFRRTCMRDVELGRTDSVLLSLIVKIPFHQSKSVS